MKKILIFLSTTLQFLFLLSFAYSKDLSLTPQEIDYLKNNPEIPLVGLPSSEPYLIEQDGEINGIIPEYLESLSKLLNTKFYVKKLIRGGEAFKLAQSADYYGHVLLLDNEVTRNAFHLTAPYFKTSFKIFSNAENASVVCSVADLEGKRIGVLHNHNGMLDYVKRFKNTEIITAYSPIEQLSLLQKNEVDLIIGYVNYHYLINLHMFTNVKFCFSAEKYSSVHIAINKQNPILVSILNKAIKLLPAYHMDSIISKWVEKYISIESQVKQQIDLGLTSEEIEWLNRHPRLRVASLVDFAPFNFLAEGKPTGYTIDYVNLLGNLLGKEIEFVTRPWRDQLELLKTGQIDVIPHIANTAERRGFVDYTSFNHIAYVTGFATRKSEQLDSLQDLTGKTVAVADKTFLYDHLRKNHPNINLLVTKNTNDAIKAVAHDKAYAVTGSFPYLNFYIQREWYSNLKTLSLPDFGLPEKTELPMGVAKGQSLLLSILEKAHSSVLSQSELQLRHKWILDVNSAEKDYSLTANEKQFLEKHPVIRFQIRANRPPFEFIKEGKPYGLAVDYLTKIAEKTGFKAEFIHADISADAALEIIESESGLFDTLPYLVASDERKKQFHFGDTYMSYPMMIISHKNGPYIGKESDLKGKTIVLEKNFLTKKWITRDFPDISIIPVNSTNEALQKINNEEADAYIGNLIVANYMMVHEGMSNLKVVAQTNYGNIKYSFVGPKRLPELTSILSKGYRSLSPSDHNFIQQKWFSVQVVETVNYSLLWKLISFLALVGILILYWNVSLRKEKNRTSKALHDLLSTQKALESRNIELQRVSRTDPLTSLYNRLKLDEVIKSEFERALRYDISFAIVLLDIDHFKKINDNFGHLAGDIFLQELSQLLKENIRRVDVLGRWGGEEFLIICPQSNIKGAFSLAENLRRKIEKYNFSQVGNQTASVGISAFKKQDSVEKIISRADTALYKSKEKGRNTVAVG